MKLAKRVAIVTGAASGIGRGVALGFAKEGCDVVISDIDLKGANAVVNEIMAMGCQSLATETDVSKSEDVNKMVESTLKKFGKIDILVNNAGGSARERASLFCESTEEVWDLVL